MLDLVIRNATVVSSGGVATADVAISGKRVVRVGKVTEEAKGEVAADGLLALPGFVDVHTNGAAGFDLTSGRFDLGLGRFRRGRADYHRGLSDAAAHFFSRGATSVLLTTIAAPFGRIERALQNYARFARSGVRNPYVGVFVEGTFIKDPACRGAQNPRYFLAPDYALCQRLQESAAGAIRVVNVPPEHGQPGYELIEKLTAEGVVCVAGHTNGTFEQFREAIRRGLRGAVHFLNGPTGSSAKGIGEGGAVEAILRSDELLVPVIPDGFHVHPAYVRDVLARVGPERFLAVTDSMFVTGFAELESFRVSGIEARVDRERGYLYVADDPDTLYGSVLTMDRAFANLVTWLTRPMEGVWHAMHPALPLEEALRLAVRACCTNPARLLGLEGRVGDLAPGVDADVVLGELIEGEKSYRFEVKLVLHKGEPVAGSGPGGETTGDG